MEAFVFPGQGSQRQAMGEDLFDQVPEFASYEPAMNELLGYSIKSICLKNPGNRLVDTRYTQPCLYVVNALYYYQAIAEGARCDYLAGHSLGEYNALLAAGVFDFMTGLTLVKKRGELMSRAKNGGMAAIIGPTIDTVLALLRSNDFDELEIANFNAPNQTVISGLTEQIVRAKVVFEAEGVDLYYQLPVSSAFHSRYMAPASEEFASYVKQFDFGKPSTPLIANVTGELYPADASSEAIGTMLAQQIVSPVRWVQSVEELIERGVTSFRELGPGDVLSKLIEQTRRSVAPDKRD